MDMRICTGCKLEKPVNEFYSYRPTRCKRCVNDYAKVMRSGKPKRYNPNDPLMKAYMKNYALTVRGRTILLLNKASARARNKGQKSTVTHDFIATKIEKGFCERTGLPFQLENHEKTYRNPYSPSIDKINPFGKYTNENVQVVCNFYNTAKGQMTDAEFVEFCRVVVSFHDQEQSQ